MQLSRCVCIPSCLSMICLTFFVNAADELPSESAHKNTILPNAVCQTEGSPLETQSGSSQSVPQIENQTQKPPSPVNQKDQITLPRDGGFAKYHAVFRKEGEMEQSSTFWLKSVGSVEVNGQRCRWIESHWKATEADALLEKHKVLFLEASILGDERPFDACLRYLIQMGEQPVMSLRRPSRPIFVWDVLSFPGFLSKSTPVEEPRTIELQSGKLQIERAWTGTYVYSRQPVTAPFKQTWETEYKVWLHSDLPIGFAAAETTLRFKIDNKTTGTWTHKYVLLESGLNAKTAIEAEDAPETP